ncbi:MAG: HDIG domain-containing protein [Deltaproteobacteria bacterium]|nr:HDIG domain-containing protein [Deltaproteobacteria bacterium]
MILMKWPAILARFRPGPKAPSASPGRPLLSSETLGRPSTIQALLILVSSVLLAFLVAPNLPFLTIVPGIGEVATQTIKSPGEFLIEDVASTTEKRGEAEDDVRAVYDLDRGVSLELESRIEPAFEGARSAPPEAAGERFLEILGTSMPAARTEPLARQGFDPEDARMLRAMVAQAMAGRIVSNQELLQDESRKGIIVREVDSRKEQVLSDLGAIIDLEKARANLKTRAAENAASIPPERLKALVALAQALVRPNLTLNRIETEERKNAARENVKPVTMILKKGEIIVRDGDPVDARHVVILQAIRDQSLNRSLGTLIGALTLFFVLLLGTTFRFAQSSIRKFRGDLRSTVFFLGTLLGMIVLSRVLLFVAEAVGSAFPFIPPDAYRYAIPVAAGAMLVRMVLNSETAVLFAALLSLIVGIMVERSLFFASMTFLSSLVGAYAVGQVQTRSRILTAGVEVGLMNAALLALWALMDGRLLEREVVAGLVTGFGGGLGAAVIVTAVTPLVEWALGTVTGLKLLELSNNDHPLMKELALKAPGTFHHSMIMASLVEAAAEQINANPLLARVSAYYHDVGKTLKPHYFVENMPPGENKHDKLSPSMSARIVKAHVKEGIELGKKYKLPEIIIDAIPQHHGTSLIKYFYDKAIQSSDPDTEEVKEMDYRYPGPKPRSRECAILMLADSAEAALRTLSDPNRARIQGAVQKIINNIFRDGQLDECDLTLRDLNNIARSFTDTLTAIYHGRIAYPEPVAKGEAARKKKADEGPADRSAEGGKDRPKRGDEVSEDDLKRLGMS